VQSVNGNLSADSLALTHLSSYGVDFSQLLNDHCVRLIYTIYVFT
jgi:hypothetical protein